jgi:hypothetical protein
LTPYFDYYTTDRSNNLYDSKTENHATGILLEYGINSIFSVGGKLSYGEESSTHTQIVTDSQTEYNSKGLIDPEVYFNSHFKFDNFRLYGNIFGHVSLENHKTSSSIENGNLSSGGPSADAEIAADAILGPMTAGLLVGSTVWKGNRQVYDNSSVKKFQLKGGEFEKYKAYFELNSLDSMKPGLIYTYRKTEPSLRLLENSNQDIYYDYGQNDSITEVYTRFRLEPSLVLIGTLSQIDSVENPKQLSQETYKTYGISIGLTLKY